MTYTFDTAWIIAQMIRTRSEAQKKLIRRRILAMDHECDPGRHGRENFESFCWAWKHDCIRSHHLLDRRPSHDPYPYYEPTK